MSAVERLRADVNGMVEMLGRDDHPMLDLKSLRISPNHARELLALHDEAVRVIQMLRPLAASWADGVGRSHPDHEVIDDADAFLAKVGGK